jgi:uncharacterized CHY-type Zn-finger protein
MSGIPVHGLEADSRTGCAHYRSALDIVAIERACCRKYYSCFVCHQVEAGNAAHMWRRAEFGEKAIVCGACGTELSIRQYLECQASCPLCGSRFNRRCDSHYHLYFETD